MSSEPRRIVFFDGACTLCNRAVRLLRRLDTKGVLEFASLHGETATKMLPEEYLRLKGAGTMVFAVEDGSTEWKFSVRSDAVFAALDAIGGALGVCARLRVIPRPVRDGVYRVVSRARLLFGESPTCALPTAADRARFLP